MKQKILFFLCLLIAVPLFAYDFESGGIYYNVLSSTDGEVEVTMGDNPYSGKVTVPNVVSKSGPTYVVTKIGAYAFANCTSLEYVSLPESITEIGKNAFSWCNSVSTFIIKALTPPVCGENALEDIDKYSCRLVVPDYALKLYSSELPWRYFKIIETLEVIDRLIHLKMIDTVLTVKISDNPLITFDSSTIRISYGNNSSYFEFSKFESLTFGRTFYGEDSSGLQDVYAESDVSVELFDRKLIVNAPVGSLIEIYNIIDGMTMTSARDSLTVDISDYHKGVYIVNINGKSFKFVNK